MDDSIGTSIAVGAQRVSCVTTMSMMAMWSRCDNETRWQEEAQATWQSTTRKPRAIVNAARNDGPEQDFKLRPSGVKQPVPVKHLTY